jgi:type IV secretory pathway VirB6-like protein
MKRLLLILALTGFLQVCPAPAHAVDIGGDCGFDQINLSDEVGRVFNERIEAVLRMVTTGNSLFGGLICIAIFSLYLDYLRGQLDWKDFMVRVGITIFLLKSYTGPGNFRDTITAAADKAADSIQFGYPGGNPLESLFETRYHMLKNMQNSGSAGGGTRVINWLGNLFGIGEIGDAAHVIALFFSPAGITTILFILTTLAVAILAYVLDVGATLLILVLSLLGPIAICFCSVKSTMRVATGWFQRFVEINLWKIITACFMVGIATVYEKLGAIAFNPQQFSNPTLTTRADF